ncbi:hypothetical protein AX774_g1429 [Zancudomyces culisetae]|uniref:Uncharacterized protein n=1 Tax=Zancudomyces culisetae TaxID=1213189 RepID=A0A1R1PVT5_ZANCU|nr:hypothetical protein AX774_g1429 [Zancudomyces culisetae]|eukprot:OMH85034.1 hypothetical protein AX774_g1429 [Zancudomyces culisetae]
MGSNWYFTKNNTNDFGYSSLASAMKNSKSVDEMLDNLHQFHLNVLSEEDSSKLQGKLPQIVIEYVKHINQQLRRIIDIERVEKISSGESINKHIHIDSKLKLGLDAIAFTFTGVTQIKLNFHYVISKELDINIVGTAIRRVFESTFRKLVQAQVFSIEKLKTLAYFVPRKSNEDEVAMFLNDIYTERVQLDEHEDHVAYYSLLSKFIFYTVVLSVKRCPE